MTKGKKIRNKPCLDKAFTKRFKYKIVKKIKNIKKNTKTQNKSKKKPKTKTKPKSAKNILAQDNSKNIDDKPFENKFEKIEKKYMDKLLDIHYDTYAETYFINALERLNQNKNTMTEKILNKFGLIEKHRKYAFCVLEAFIKLYKINFKLYFSTITLFDSFLIKFSESNDEKICSNLFISKKSKKFSDTKLVLVLFCCYYLTTKFSESNLLLIDDLLNFPKATDEFNYNDLFELIRDIILYTDCNIDNLNIYSFLELYLFQIRRCVKNIEWENNQKFMDILINNSFSLGTEISKKLFDQNIQDSIKALGVVVICYKLCKRKHEINNTLDSYIQMLLSNLNNYLSDYYGIDNLPNFINLLNDINFNN